MNKALIYVRASDCRDRYHSVHWLKINRVVPMASPQLYVIFLLSLYSVCILKEVNATSYKGAMLFEDGSLNFANFVPFFNHTLINNSAVVESRAVKDQEECIETCTENANCRSVNFKTIPDANGKYNCQLLDTDKFAEKNNRFIASWDFHHFSFTVCQYCNFMK